MTDAIKLTFPQLNPNEPDAVLAGLHVKEGQQVKPGDMLYTLETTKSTAEVTAEQGGYIVGIRAAAGDSVSAGELFAYLAPSQDWKAPKVKKAAAAAKGEIPDGLRITDPALALARQHDLDLNSLPQGLLVTESLILSRVAPGIGEIIPLPEKLDSLEIVVYGGGGHGKSVIDLIRAQGEYQVVGVIDDGKPAGEEILGLPILGGGGALAGLKEGGLLLAANAVGGIGNAASRAGVFAKLAQAGLACPSLIHPTAFVEANASLSLGVQVFPQAYIGSEAVVGFGSIINTGAIVSHDCLLGEAVNISPGAILAGAVKVGDQALIGMGATVNLNVSVGARAQIGNGATVKADVPAGGIVRAGAIWPN
ncbi:MAG: NeuD/PglB/VioB family sugar acetyltransferase [Anaerolineae bacterium]|nr:NeuD/PglB/VioB family sugar acetyltransferase [Anaerolineae bacterium]